MNDYDSMDFWAKAPKGATHYIPSVPGCVAMWVKFDGERYYYSFGKYVHFKLWERGDYYKDRLIKCPFIDDDFAQFSQGEKPPVGHECEALWNSRSVNGEAEYKRVKILSHDRDTIVYRWLEGPETGELGRYGEKDCYWNVCFRPIQPKAEEAVKEPETVPKWKFDALVKELEFYQNKLADSNHLHNKIKMFVDKDVWFWETDGENHLESLVCPIVIDADVLRSLIKNGG